MYKTDSRLQSVLGDTHISRYMDFTSFYSLLRNQTLFFKRLDRYTDKLEGQIFDETVVEFKAAILIKDPDISIDYLQKMADNHVENIKTFRERTLSNSWNIGSEENYAMWKIYLRGSTEGVAIRTTVNKLISQLNLVPNKEFYSGKVYYEPIHDYDTNQFRVSTTKRKSYAYENEYRILILHQFKYGKPTIPKYDLGVSVKIDVQETIEQIYISPFANGWFRSVVEDMITDMLPLFKHTNIISSIIQDT